MRLRTVILERRIITTKGILGIIKRPDGVEICRTLENPYINNRPDISCIPEGNYLCTRDYIGKFKHFKLQNIRGRSNIEIHCGNFEKDTKGCILLGEEWIFYKNELMITNSRTSMRLFKESVLESFTLDIKRRDDYLY